MKKLTMNSSAFAPSPGRKSVNRRSSPSSTLGRGDATLASAESVIRSWSSESVLKGTDRDPRLTARRPTASRSRFGRGGQARGGPEPAMSDLVPALDQRPRQVLRRARVGGGGRPECGPAGG